MANQRKKGKKLVGAHLDESERKWLKDEATRRGISVAEIFREIIRERMPADLLKKKRGNNHTAA
jgi:hypothetical protein